MTYLVGGLPLIVFTVLALRRLAPSRATRWKLFALLCAVLPAALHSVTAWWAPHYSAAATGPLLLLGTMGMREASLLRWKDRRLGATFAVWLPPPTLFVRPLRAPLQWRAFRPPPRDTDR